MRWLFGGILALAAVLWLAAPLPLRVWDHARVRAHQKFQIWEVTWYHRAIWARRADFDQRELGGVLLAHPGVVAARVEDLIAKDQDDSDDESILRYRGEWSLYFSGLRRQGLDVSAIVARPEGPRMLLGVLAAEARPPRWWSGHWLAAGRTPDASLKMGLVTREDARAAFATLTKAIRPRDRGYLSASLFVLAAHPWIAPEAERERIVADWAASREEFFNKNALRSAKQALALRARFRELLGPEPKLAFHVEPGLPADSETVVREFLGVAGVTAMPGTEPVTLSRAAVRFDEVTSAKITESQRVVREYLPTGGQRYVTRRAVDKIVTDRHRESAGTAAEDVVSLVLEVRGEHFALPPVGDPQKEALKDPSRMDVLAPWRWGRSAYAFGWEP
jgi:hypothetical protein